MGSWKAWEDNKLGENEAAGSGPPMTARYIYRASWSRAPSSTSPERATAYMPRRWWLLCKAPRAGMWPNARSCLTRMPFVADLLPLDVSALDVDGQCRPHPSNDLSVSIFADWGTLEIPPFHTRLTLPAMTQADEASRRRAFWRRRGSSRQFILKSPIEPWVVSGHPFARVAASCSRSCLFSRN